MSTDQLIQLGRKEIQSTDQALIRAQKVVADTIDVGTKTAETLEGQTKQLERVMDDLDEIHFTLKKASAVIRDITRGLATDKCASDQAMWMPSVLQSKSYAHHHLAKESMLGSLQRCTSKASLCT